MSKKKKKLKKKWIDSSRTYGSFSQHTLWHPFTSSRTDVVRLYTESKHELTFRNVTHKNRKTQHGAAILRLRDSTVFDIHFW